VSLIAGEDETAGSAFDPAGLLMGTLGTTDFYFLHLLLIHAFSQLSRRQTITVTQKYLPALGAVTKW
jgi:hypothetical protein